MDGKEVEKMKYKFESKTPRNQIIEFHLGYSFRGRKAYALIMKCIDDNIPCFVSYKTLFGKEMALFTEKVNKKMWGIKLFYHKHDEGKHEHYDYFIDTKNGRFIYNKEKVVA